MVVYDWPVLKDIQTKPDRDQYQAEDGTNSVPTQGRFVHITDNKSTEIQPLFLLTQNGD